MSMIPKHCLNINLKEIQHLVDELQFHPKVITSMIEAWQERRNNYDIIPTARQLYDYGSYYTDNIDTSLIPRFIIRQDEIFKKIENIYGKDLTKSIIYNFSSDNGRNLEFQDMVKMPTLKQFREYLKVSNPINVLNRLKQNHNYPSEDVIDGLRSTKVIVPLKFNKNIFAINKYKKFSYDLNYNYNKNKEILTHFVNFLPDRFSFIYRNKPNSNEQDRFKTLFYIKPDGIKFSEIDSRITTNEIYNKLPLLTNSNNVKVDSRKIKVDKKVEEFKKINSNGIIAYRRNTNETEQSFIDALEKENAIGNPFGQKSGAVKTIKKSEKATEEGTKYFIKWVIGEDFTDFFPKYREKVIELLKKSKGEKIWYYRELNEPSHANAIDYLINEYNWNNKIIKIEQLDLFKQQSPTQVEDVSNVEFVEENVTPKEKVPAGEVNFNLLTDKELETGFSELEISHLVNVTSNAFIRIEEKLRELKLINSKNQPEKIKDILIQAIRDEIDENENIKNDINKTILCDKWLKDLSKENSIIWTKTKQYLQNLRKIKIYEDYNENLETTKKSSSWDELKQLQRDVSDEIAYKIKDLINTTQKLNNERSFINEEGHLIKHKETNTLTGFAESLDFDVVYNYLMENLSGLPTVESMLNRLYVLGSRHDISLIEIYHKLVEDKQLANAFFVGFNKQIPKRYASFFTGEVIKNDIENKFTFSQFKIANDWINNIYLKVENNEFVFDFETLKVNKDFLDNYAVKENTLLTLLKTHNENKDEIYTAIQDLFSLLGVNLNKKTIAYKFEVEPVNNDFLSTANYFFQKSEILKEHVTKIDPFTSFQEYGLINELADIEKFFIYKKSNLAFINISKNKVYSPTYHNFISNFFAILKSKDKELINNLIKSYLLSPKMKYSNFLFNTSKIENRPNGFLDYFPATDILPERYEINEKFIDKFNYFIYTGRKDLITQNAEEYVEIIDDLSNLINYLQPAENFGIDFKPMSLNIGENSVFYGVTVPITHIKSNKLFINNKVNRNHALWKNIYNIFLQEYEDIKNNTRVVFKTTVDKEGYEEIVIDSNTGQPVINEEVAFQQYKHYDKKGNILTKDGKPAGRGFKFWYLDIIEDNNERKYVQDLVPELFDEFGFIRFDYTKLESQNTTPLFDNNGSIILVKKESTQEKIENFIDLFIKNQIKTATSYFSQYENYLKTLKTKNGTLLINENYTFEDFITEYSLNSLIANVEFQRFFGNNINASKDNIDNNKRASQIVKPKSGFADAHETYNAITIKSINLSSSVYENIEKNTTETDKNIRKTFKEFEIADAASFITYEEWKKRLEKKGILSEYQPLIDYLEGRESNKITEFLKIQIQKNFFYDYMYDNDVKDFIESQVKNAERVLHPKLIGGSQLEDLYNFMIEQNIQQVDFESAHKMGAKNIILLHDVKDGSLKIDDNILKIIKNSIEKRRYSGLGVQQDVVDHIEDTENKRGVQIDKKIWDNLQLENDYILRTGEILKGKELIKKVDELLSDEIKDQKEKLFNELGIDEAKKDDNGNYILKDINKLYKILYEKAIKDNLDNNILLALRINKELNRANMPISSSLFADKAFSMLNSLFTNNITNLKAPGIHVPLIPSAFSGSKKVSDNLQSKRSTEKVKWIDGYDSNRRLKAETIELGNTNLTIAEVVLTAWDSRFYDENGELIDVNLITEDARTMLGYRIPTEDKHSMIVFKVVGFLPRESGSAAILPDDFSPRSGSDFDIDTIYTMYYNIFQDSKGFFKVIDGEKEDKSLYRQNQILDVYISILRNKVHYKALNSPNTFTDITTVRDYYNNLLGINSKNVNSVRVEDLERNRRKNLESKMLKGNSVANDAFFSIAQRTNMYINDDNVFIQKVENLTKEEIKYLTEAYGKDFIKFESLNSGIIKFKYLGNNPKGITSDAFKGLNADGKLISDIFGQATANILDIIKQDLPNNVNLFTLTIWKNFSMLGFKGGWEFGTAYINQPIILDLTNEYNESQKITFNGNRNRYFETVKNKYLTELFQQTKHNINPKDRDKYEKQIKKYGCIYVDVKEIKDLFDLSSDTQTAFSIKELNDFITAKHKNVNWLKNQLRILENYKIYSKVENATIAGIKQFSTDKLGTGKSLQTTIDLIKIIRQGNEPGKNILRIGNTSAVKAIYPKFFGDKKNKSVYKPLQTYLYSSNIASLKLLSGLDINRKLPIQIAVEDAKLINPTLNTESIKKYQTFLINYLLKNKIPFFKDIDIVSLYGIKNIKNYNLDLTDLNNFEEFNTLSLANKIYLIQQQFKDIIKEDNIFSYISVDMSDKYFKENKKHKVDFLQDSNDYNVLIQSFKNIVNNKNEFISEVGKDLIRYAFINNDFLFGFTSISKVIPYEFLINPDLGISNSDFGIGYADAFYNLMNELSKSDVTVSDKEIYTLFQQLNSNSSNIVPIVKKKFIFIKEINKFIKDESYPTWEFEPKGFVRVYRTQLKKEDTNVKNSDVLNILVNQEGVYKTILVKKFDNYGDFIYYYPISKLEKGETGNYSVIEENNPPKTELEYLSLIREDINKFQKLKQQVNTQDSEKNKEPLPEEKSPDIIGSDLLQFEQGGYKYKINFFATSDETYGLRTKINAEKTDATIALAFDFNTFGENQTKTFAGKKYISVNLNNKNIDYDDIVKKLNTLKASSINFAGNSLEKLIKYGMTQKEADLLAVKILKGILQHKNLKTKIDTVFTGGQSGIDESFAKAARDEGLSVFVVMPKYWKYSDEKGEDVKYKKEESLKRFDFVKYSMIDSLPYAESREYEKTRRNIADIEKLDKIIAYSIKNFTNAKHASKIFQSEKKLRSYVENIDNVAITQLRKYNVTYLNTALITVLRYNLETINDITDKLNYYDNEINIEDLIKNETDKTKFANTLRYTLRFLNSYVSIKELEIITTEIEENEMTSINETIEKLKDLEPQISSLISQKDRILNRFYEALTKNVSKNPQIVDGVRNILIAQRDLNGAELALGSLFDVENSLVANMAKIYATQMTKRDEQIAKEKREFKNLYDVEFKNKTGEIAINHFIDNFIVKDEQGNPTGYLIQKYDYAKFYKEKHDFFESIYHLKNENYNKWKKLKNDWLDENLNWNSEKDGLNINDAIAIKQEELIQSEFLKWLKHNTIYNFKTKRYYWNNEPSDKFLNSKYDKIKDNAFYNYIYNKLIEYSKNYIGNELSKGQLPYMFKGEEKGLIDTIIKKAGWFDSNTNEIVGENDEIVRFLPMDFIKKIQYEKPIKFPKRGELEDYIDYEDRVVTEINKQGYNFESIKDIKDYNYKVNQNNLRENASKITYDIEAIMTNFMLSSLNYKFKKEIESQMLLAGEVIKSDSFKVLTKDNKGNSIINKIRSELLEEDSFVESSGKNSNLDKRYQKFLEMVLYEQFEADEGNLTKLTRVLQNYTSAKNMWWNLTGGINNVAFGQTQIAMERFSGYFWNREDGNKAEKNIWSAVIDTFSNKDKLTNSNKNGAIIRQFNILETQDEVALKDPILNKIRYKLMNTNIFYIQQHIGEFYMQNKVLFSMLHSHRIVNKEIVSFADFSRKSRIDTLNEILDEQGKEDLNNFLKNNRKNIITNTNIDYVQQFLLKYITKKETLNKYKEAFKEKEASLQAEFENNPTIYETITFEDGISNFNKDLVNTNEYEMFRNKIIHVNQKIHGIYNQMDAGTIQNKALGRLAIQFRKHLRPGWNKRFGSKFGSKFFNESRVDYDKGSYISLWELITKPIGENKDEYLTQEEYDTLNAAKNLVSDFNNYFSKVKLYWNTLDAFEKSNVKRALHEMLTLMGYLILLSLLNKIRDDEDEDNYALNWSIYQASRMKSELATYIPVWGWFNESMKILQNPTASENALSNFITFLIRLFAYPFQDEEDRIYKSGVYAKENKLKVAFEKIVPLTNQYVKMKRLQSYVNYYHLYNPL